MRMFFLQLVQNDTMYISVGCRLITNYNAWVRMRSLLMINDFRRDNVVLWW